jgi:transcriptional regulator with XRE-family HTH domain
MLQDILRAAWFGPLTFEEVASANGVSTRTLQRFWSGEKKVGALPATPRPHFAAFDHNANATEVDPPAPSLAPDAVDDDVVEINGVSCLSRHAAPIASPWGLSITSGDPLLAVLREHHPDAEHTAPVDWLKRDRDSYYAPKHTELMAMAHAYDLGDREWPSKL